MALTRSSVAAYLLGEALTLDQGLQDRCTGVRVAAYLLGLALTQLLAVPLKISVAAYLLGEALTPAACGILARLM